MEKTNQERSEGGITLHVFIRLEEQGKKRGKDWEVNKSVCAYSTYSKINQ